MNDFDHYLKFSSDPYKVLSHFIKNERNSHKKITHEIRSQYLCRKLKMLIHDSHKVMWDIWDNLIWFVANLVSIAYYHMMIVCKFFNKIKWCGWMKMQTGLAKLINVIKQLMVRLSCPDTIVINTVPFPFLNALSSPILRTFPGDFCDRISYNPQPPILLSFSMVRHSFIAASFSVFNQRHHFEFLLMQFIHNTNTRR